MSQNMKHRSLRVRRPNGSTSYPRVWGGESAGQRAWPSWKTCQRRAQFPAKTDLMVAGMEAVAAAEGAEYEAQIAKSSATEWLNQLPAMMWGVISRPAGVAVMEIMLASRADPDLAERLRAMQTAIYQRAQSFVARRHADAGMTPRADGHAVYRVLLAAIRGLALEGVFMNSEEDVDSALGILTESFQLLNPSLPRPPER